MAHLIKRTDLGMPQYFSLSVGREYASPMGGWTMEPDMALQFARDKDAKQFVETLLPQVAPFCEVTPHG